MDVMATFLEVTGAIYPDNEIVQPLQGKSLIPLFMGKDRDPYEALYFRFRDCRALRKGDWKVVSFYGSQWELYNMVNDRTEQNDLALKYPGIVEELSSQWHLMAEETDMLLEKERQPVRDLPASNTNREWHRSELVDDWSLQY